MTSTGGQPTAYGGRAPRRTRAGGTCANATQPRTFQRQVELVPKEHAISSFKQFAAAALTLIALGTAAAQASAYPPGPSVTAGSATATAATYPPGPTVVAAFPPGPTRSIIAV
jgi:hypothetical protein